MLWISDIASMSTGKTEVFNFFQDSGDGPISIPSSPEKNGAEDQEEEGEGGEEEEQD